MVCRLLVRKAGSEPIGLCVRSCTYHVGLQCTGWSSAVELDVLSTAMYEARMLAMERMRREAKKMGAEGIVGVRLTVKRLEWDSKVLEFVAIGPALFTRRGVRVSRAHATSRSQARCRGRTSGPCCRPATVRSRW